ncbi:hypothetical protein Bbelb_258190 [Branchiostoma belcheri]|nr:hypothetical protein Bbelb_258190 [Branchiostoma belcheri]
MYEGLLRDLLLQDTANTLLQSQHGFLPKRSTVTALIHILQSWHEALNSNPKLDIHAVFVDFSRAFDTINHGQLLLTLADFGVRRDLWLSIRSYLEGRSQRVKWGSCLSKPHDVLAGVPQGGLLSPLLFVICINSLDTCLPSSVLPVKYADDLTNSEFLMGSLPGQTQRALDAITEWSVPFSLATNGGKTKDMIVSARRKENVPVPPHPTVDGKQIERVVTFKLLGVQISADLTWDAHVQYMLSKTRPRIYYLAAARKAGLPPDVLTQIYLSFIRPILEYASPVWGGLPIRLTHILEGVQKRCCRIMGIPTNSLPTLASRRDQATLRVFRSILDDKDNPLNCFISCPLHSGYDLRRVRHVMTSHSRTKRHEQSFFPRAIKLYNMS